MTFPSVLSITPSSWSTTVTDHNVSLGATVDPGDILLLLCVFPDTNANPTQPPSGDGWESINNYGSAGVWFGAFWKEAVGDEDGTTVNLQTATAMRGAAQVYRIRAQGIHGTAHIAQDGTGVTPTLNWYTEFDPPYWPTDDTLWIAVALHSGSNTASTTPTNYGNLTETASGGTGAESTLAGLSSARRELNAASEVPGNWGLSGSSTAWIALAIAWTRSTYIAPSSFGSAMPRAATAVPAPTLTVRVDLAPSPVAAASAVPAPTRQSIYPLAPPPTGAATATAMPTLDLPMAQGIRRVEVHDPTTQALIEVLDRAYRVSYDLQVNAAPVGSFMLPRDDPKWYCIVPFYEVWIWNELNELIDIFRIAPIQERHAAEGTIAQVKLEGFACALQDDIVPAEIIFTNQTVTTILTTILGYQRVARISLGTVDAALDKTISTRISYVNLMRACWETRNIVGGFISVDPVPGNPAQRRLNLRADPGQDIGQRIGAGWNLRAIAKSTESTGIVTRVYPLGRGEGVNQMRPSTNKIMAEPATFTLHAGGRSTLTFTRTLIRYKGWVAAGSALPDGYGSDDRRVRPMKVWRGATDETANFEQGADERTLRSKTNDYNPGAGAWTVDFVAADYLIADTEAALYGFLTNVYVNKNIENSAALIEEAMNYLNSVSSPRVSHEVSVADLARIYRDVTFERFHLYDKVNVWDDALDVTTKDRIVGLRYSDMDDPATFSVVVSDLPLAALASRTADVRDRVRKYEQQPDGATTLLGPDSFEDNLDATHPYTRNIEIPADAVTVISVKLRMRTKAYRYYVSAAAGSASDNSQASSQSTTQEENYHNHLVQSSWTQTGNVSASQSGNQSATHNHSDPQGGTTGNETQNHAHDIYHTHGYNMASSVTNAGSDHTHGMSHTHQHSHTITVTLTATINEGATPTTMQVVVDGTVASASATSLDDFDLIPYLSKNTDGTIVRGLHTVAFTPNSVGRVQATITGVVFLQSRGVISG